MRSRLVLAGLVILVASGTSLVVHRPSFSRPQTKTCGPSRCGAQIGDPVPHELNFAYFSLRDGFKSTLLLVSDSPGPIDFTLTPHNLSGKPLAVPQMTIQPQEKLAIELGTLLKSAGTDFTDDFAEGSVLIRYRAMGPMPLVGQITVENPDQHLVYESQMTENDPGMSDISPVLNALWWGLGTGREASFAISNTADQRASADVFLDFLGKRHASHSLDFRPHETKVLLLRELLSELDVSPARRRKGELP